MERVTHVQDAGAIWRRQLDRKRRLARVGACLKIAARFPQRRPACLDRCRVETLCEFDVTYVGGWIGLHLCEGQGQVLKFRRSNVRFEFLAFRSLPAHHEEPISANLLPASRSTLASAADSCGRYRRRENSAAVFCRRHDRHVTGTSRCPIRTGRSKVSLIRRCSNGCDRRPTRRTPYWRRFPRATLCWRASVSWKSAAPGAVSRIDRTPSGRIFFLRREPSENQFKLVWRDGFERGRHRDRRSGSDLEGDGTVARCRWTTARHRTVVILAYSLQVGGSEIGLLHVVDVASGKPVIEPIDRIRFASGVVAGRRQRLFLLAPARRLRQAAADRALRRSHALLSARSRVPIIGRCSARP